MYFLLTWVARSHGPLWKAEYPFQAWGYRILEMEGPRDVSDHLLSSSCVSCCPLGLAPLHFSVASHIPSRPQPILSIIDERKDLRKRKFVVELDMDSSSCYVMWGFLIDFFFFLILVWFLKPLLVPEISLGENSSGFFSSVIKQVICFYDGKLKIP